jgi:muconate cycloisomerase
MKITGLELIPVFSTREMGRSSPSDSDKAVSYHVIVRLYTDAGVVGLGEMSDIDFASDPATVERLQAKLEPLLLGRSPFDRAAIALELESRTWDHQVMCGIDIAVHDAVAKALDVPLYVLFGGKLRDRIPFSYPLARCQTGADVAANVERVEWLQGLGHNMVRYYFGADIDLDHRLLTEIRRRGVSVNALDASGRLDVSTAIDAIDRLAEFEPNLVESPVSGRHDAAVEDFLAVKEAVEVPIGEHIASAEVAERLARHDAIDVFNTGLGYEGFDFCVKTFALADLFGIKTLIGSTVELSIGTAARAHVAAAMTNLDLPIYPSGPLVYYEQVVKEKVRYEDGHVIVPDGPGVGVELDEERLEAQRV